MSSFSLAFELNNFDFRKLLGSGGFGTTYLVNQVLTGKQYAAKLIDINDMESKGASIRDLMEEIAILANLSSDPEACNYVSCYHKHFMARGEDIYVKLQARRLDAQKINLDDEYLIIIMDYIDTGSLEDVLKRVRFVAPDLALRLFLNLAKALAIIHGKNYAHRDLHMGNVMLDSITCQPKLIDFGLSCGVNASPCNNKAGHPRAMPPDAFDEPFNLYKAQKQDIFALGLIFFKILNKAENAFDMKPIYYGTVKYETSDVSRRNASRYNLAAFNALIDAMLSLDAERRPDAFFVLQYLEDLVPNFTKCVMSDGSETRDDQMSCKDKGGRYYNPRTVGCRDLFPR